MATTAPRPATFDLDLVSCHPALLTKARHLELSEAAAQDLVQDTFERALRQADRFAAGTNLRAWLLTILFHLFVDRCRQRTFDLSFERLGDARLPIAEEREVEPAWKQLDAAAVVAALERLPEQLREPLDLRARLRLSYQEIASRLHLPARTVGTRLHRARTRLRAALARDPFAESPSAVT
jgi:RNA polymerase sigma-70 factor, ECF subfamily